MFLLQVIYNTDSELAETGCEYAMVGDQKFGFQYELYVLPGFEGILPLETWNYYLAED